MKIQIKIFLFIIFAFFFLFTFASASTNVDLFQITIDGSQQKDPIIYKNLVAYDSLSDIWAYNLETQTNYPLIQKDGEQYLTGFYKNLVVYDNLELGASVLQVRMYNIKTGRDTLIAGGSGSHSGGVTNGKYVVYIAGGACGSIHKYNLKNGSESEIISSACGPIRISGDTVVFLVADPSGTNIKGYDLKHSNLFDVTTDPGFQEAANIFGDKVVWLDYITGARGDYNGIKMKDLKTGEEKTIYESSTNSIQWPTISSKYVVWSESSAQDINGVKAADLKSGEIFEVQPQGPQQNSHTTPSIWKNMAVWMSSRTGNGDIYGARFSKE